MECKMIDGKLQVTLPFDKKGRDCKPSKDGSVKNTLHVSSGGFVPTGISLNGKPLKLNVTGIAAK